MSTAGDDEVFWQFDGGDGRKDVLAAMLARHLRGLDDLLPEESDDPLQRLSAELSDVPEARIEDDATLLRLFPPALDDEAEASRFRQAAVAQQAQNRMEAARRVLDEVMQAEDDVVDVTFSSADAWVKTLTAMRVQWHVELTGSGDRMAEVRPKHVTDNPTAAAISDWLGYLIEDILESRELVRSLREDS